jgi:hypothetical protein
LSRTIRHHSCVTHPGSAIGPAGSPRPSSLAAGNSNEDIEMLEFAEASGKPFLNLLLHHDDAAREYAFDKEAKESLQLARERGWMVVSMKEDFATVFPWR